MTAQRPQPSPASELRALHRAAVLLGLTVFLAMALVHHPNTGWNQNTRMALLYAVVETGSFSIDPFHDAPGLATMDKAIYDGRLWSDKIIGLPLLALPWFAGARAFHGSLLPVNGAYFVSNAGAVALCGGVSAALFFLLLARLGTPPRRAVLLTLLSVFGTMWFGYATVFYPYVPGLAMLLGALVLALFPPGGRLTALNSAAIGFLLGFALLLDLIFGLAVFGVGVIWLLRLADQLGVLGSRAFAEMRGERSRLAGAAGLALLFWVGVLVPLSLFVAYSVSIFGTPTIPYEYEVNERFREGMAQGVFGVTRPRLDVLYFITVHPFRGILVWSPVVLAAAAGCVMATRSFGKRRLMGWLGLWSLAAYLLFNSGYYMWWGGWGMGPRFLVPMLPFLLLGLGELAQPRERLAIRMPAAVYSNLYPVAVALGLASVALSLPLSLTDPVLPQGNQDGVLEAATFGTRLEVPQFVVLRAFYGGRIQVWPWRRLAGVVSGESRGLNGLSVLVFVAMVGGGGWLAWWRAPSRLSGAGRSDFPFRTMDGSAAPPPRIP